MKKQDKKLIGACLNGKKPAWDAFVRQYSRLVYHTISKTSNFYHVEAGNNMVEDLFQDFFLSLIRDEFRKSCQFKGKQGASLASWLRDVTPPGMGRRRAKRKVDT